MADRPATQGPAATLRPDRWTVERFASVDSTNRWLLDAARDGAAAGLVAVADHQDEGRGRRGRTWESAPGDSLLVSVLLRPNAAVDRVHVVTIAAALALVDALASVVGLVADLKWPNDVLVGERKLAGLLAEADVVGGDVEALVVGAGCNLAQRSFPGELRTPATSCLLETGAAPDRDALLSAFLEAFGDRLDGIERVVREYRERLATLGRRVRVELEGGALEGTATDVDADGRLVVTPDAGTPVVIAAGDVVHLRAT
jgi:BirA family transcriptional regulator, biotin operon repressor / biotin---[acetyl-CoA-carboxylase] ligase